MRDYPRPLIRFAPDCDRDRIVRPGSPPDGQVAERNEILRRLPLLEVDERQPRGSITLPTLKPLER